jgi:hypothetical protein
MQELPITSSYVHSRFDFNTFTMGNHVPESTLTLSQSRHYPPVRDFGFGLCTHLRNPFPRIWTHIRGRYLSAKMDNISLLSPASEI